MPLEPETVHLKKSGFELGYYGELVAKKLPLLFVHGAAGNGLLWEEQLTGLATDFCPLAVDLPGHGNSGGKPAAHVPLYRDYIKDFQESFNLPPFVLTGHSMGGAIALLYALQYPQDLKAVVLISTGAKLRVAPRVLKTYEQGQQNVELISSLYGPETRNELLEEGKKMLLNVQPEVSFADFSACNKFDIMDQLHRIALPVLILCGDRDLLTPPKYSQFLAQKITGSQLKIFPGSGHMLMQEKSKDVNKAIADFAAAL